VKDGSRGERDLVPAGSTLPAPPPHQGIAMRVGASGTFEALGPAAGSQVLLASLFGGELRLEFAQVFGNGGRATRLHYQLWFAETTG
jgi:hypothetical protein